MRKDCDIGANCASGGRVDRIETISLTEEDQFFAHEIHARYAAKQGSEHIATSTALAHLSACLRIRQPRIVVECGAGIGTITEALLRHPAHVEKVLTLEGNDFCLQALHRNLAGQDPDRYSILTSPQDLARSAVAPDLLIIDGGFGSKQEMACVTPGTLVFFEGVRSGYRRKMAAFLADYGLSINPVEYGAQYAWKLRFHWPFLVRRRKAKGCYIAEVQRKGRNGHPLAISRP